MKLVERCPVCNGTGLVPYNFYHGGEGYYSTTTGPMQQIPCRSCNGTGVIKFSFFEEEYAELKKEYEELQKNVTEFITDVKTEVTEKKSVVKEKLIEFINKL